MFVKCKKAPSACPLETEGQHKLPDGNVAARMLPKPATIRRTLVVVVVHQPNELAFLSAACLECWVCGNSPHHTPIHILSPQQNPVVASRLLTDNLISE